MSWLRANLGSPTKPKLAWANCFRLATVSLRAARTTKGYLPSSNSSWHPKDSAVGGAHLDSPATRPAQRAHPRRSTVLHPALPSAGNLAQAFGASTRKMTSSQGNGPRAITRVRQRRAKTTKLSRSPTNAPGFKRARPPARTALICQIAKRLAAATEQYEQDELIWRLTAALHAPGLPDVDQTTADANWSLVCLTTGVGVPPVIPSRDMHAANDLIETPSVGSIASVRANRVSTLLDDENVCFTGSELFDWAVAIEAPSALSVSAPSPVAVLAPTTAAPAGSSPSHSVEREVSWAQPRVRTISVPFEQKLSRPEANTCSSVVLSVGSKVVLATSTVPIGSTVLAPSTACISPVSTLDLP